MKEVNYETEPVHNYFGLSYAQYLVIPRSVLQSMPQEWQQRFVNCLKELNETIDWMPSRGCYRVTLNEIDEGWNEDGDLIGKWGKEIDDPLMDYDRGRRRILFKGDDL